MPVCSIIVPTYNRAPLLRRLLDALERQDIGSTAFEVIVTDDGSTDETAAVLAQPRPYPLRTLRQANGGPGAARNAAIALARGEIIVFFDDDVEPEDDAVRAHAEAHEHDASLVVIGAMHAHQAVRTPWTAWELRTLGRQYDNMRRRVYEPTPRQFFTANASVRREHIIAAGMFDETFRRAEDVELAYRMEDLGLRFVFRPGIGIWHDPDRSLDAWRGMARQYGRYDVVLWRDRAREHVLRLISTEFAERRRPLRSVSRLIIGRPAAFRATTFAAMIVARVAYAARISPVAMAACSFVFNCEFYQGVAAELGGRKVFWRAIDHPAPDPALASVAGAPRFGSGELT